MRLRIALEPVARYVGLRHVRFDSLTALQEAVARIAEERIYDDEEVDFLDGVVFSADESYLCLGRRTDEPGPVSDYSGVTDKQAVFYRSIRHGGPAGSVVRDRLTIRDYL